MDVFAQKNRQRSILDGFVSIKSLYLLICLDFLFTAYIITLLIRDNGTQ
jgi:hypothetical protein